MATFASTPKSRKSHQIKGCCLCFCGITAISSAIAIILTGVLVARPGIWSQDFINTTCHVSYNKQNGNGKCSCGENCNAEYPCFQVFVKYQVKKADDSDAMESMIHLDETLGVSSEGCSFLPSCTNSYSENSRSAYELLTKWGQPGLNYTCLYDPVESEYVIIYRKFTELGIILSVAIPGACLVISGILTLYLLVSVVTYFSNLYDPNNTGNVQPNQAFQQSPKFNSFASNPPTVAPTYNSMFQR